MFQVIIMLCYAGTHPKSRLVSAGTLMSASDTAVAPDAKIAFDLPGNRRDTGGHTAIHIHPY